MKRRAVVAGLGTAITWLRAVLAHQPGSRMRRVGALFGIGKDAGTERNFVARRYAMQIGSKDRIFSLMSLTIPPTLLARAEKKSSG
jgi:hypothetical protein